jgi:hypothetical protein
VLLGKIFGKEFYNKNISNIVRFVRLSVGSKIFQSVRNVAEAATRPAGTVPQMRDEHGRPKSAAVENF